MLSKLLKIAKSETGLYLIFGGLTTLVNYIVFIVFLAVLGYDRVLLVNTLAFVIAATFAYFTNKLFVFHSTEWKFKVLIREAVAFFAARIFSYLFEQAGLYLSTDVLRLERFSLLGLDGVLIAKILLSVGVVLINWVISKFFIFKKTKG